VNLCQITQSILKREAHEYTRHHNSEKTN
jgi:hypothetical protein